MGVTICVRKDGAMENIYTIPMEHGNYLFKLEHVIVSRNISKNQLMRETNTDFKVLQRLMKGDLTRIDINVMARLCDYLQCEITDLIEYVSNV